MGRIGLRIRSTPVARRPCIAEKEEAGTNLLWGDHRLYDNENGVSFLSEYPLQKMPLNPTNSWFPQTSWRSVPCTSARSSAKG